MSEVTPDKIDALPLFKLLTETLMEAPGFLARGVVNVASGIGAAVNGAINVATDAVGAGKDAVLGGSKSRDDHGEMRAVKVEVPLEQTRQNDFHIGNDQLGQLSPSVGGVAGRSNGGHGL